MSTVNPMSARRSTRERKSCASSSPARSRLFMVISMRTTMSLPFASGRDADHLLGIAAEVRGQPVVLGVVRNEHRESYVGQEVDAGKEVLRVELTGQEQVVHGDLDAQ